MSLETIEERVQRLEQLNTKQQLQIERLQAAREIENMFSRYEYYHVNEQHQKVIDMFSHKPSTTLHFGEQGYWQGPDAAKRGWSTLMGRTPQPGEMHFHPTMCPIVEVAADGKTAKGVWTTWGFETGTDRKTGKLKSQYAWGTYGVDFIKEDGVWKFWHFHIYRLASYEYNKPWTELDGWNPDPEKGETLSTEAVRMFKTDFPGVDDYPYRRDKVVVIKPDPPLPYEKWEDVLPS